MNLLMCFVRITAMKKLSYTLTLICISYGVPLLYLAILALLLDLALIIKNITMGPMLRK